MRDPFPGEVERGRVLDGPQASKKGEPFGLFYLNHNHVRLNVIASSGSAEIPWEHVSVSTQGRVPTWAEMEWVKRRFWKSDEVCMQLHVAVDDHINIHPFVLHIWRPVFEDIPLPPRSAV